MQYNAIYSNYYSSVPVLKSQECENKGRKYMLFDGLLALLSVASQHGAWKNGRVLFQS